MRLLREALPVCHPDLQVRHFAHHVRPCSARPRSPPHDETKLRERMILEMTLRGLSDNTQRAYLQAVSPLTRHYGRSPSRIPNHQVKAYLFHLHQSKNHATSTCIVAAVALRFFYHKVLGRSRTDFDIPVAHKPRKLPQLLRREEVARLLAHTPSPQTVPRLPKADFGNRRDGPSWHARGAADLASRLLLRRTSQEGHLGTSVQA